MDTMWSPAERRWVMVVVAANPLEKVMACLAPSKEARHCSRTSLVGLPLRPYSYFLKSAGASCLKVVEREIGGTTAMLFHCSGSCPACKALVAKCLSF